MVDEWLRGALFEYVVVEIDVEFWMAKLPERASSCPALICYPQRVELVLLSGQSQCAKSAGLTREWQHWPLGPFPQREPTCRLQLAQTKMRASPWTRLDDIWDLAPERRDQPGPAERRGWSPRSHARAAAAASPVLRRGVEFCSTVCRMLTNCVKLFLGMNELCRRISGLQMFVLVRGSRVF